MSTQTPTSARITLVEIAPQLVNVADAAHLASVSEDAIWSAINRADLPAFRLGPRTVRLQVSDLMEWATRTPYTPSNAA